MKYRRIGRSICRTVNISLSACIAFLSLIIIRLANYKGSQDPPLQKTVWFCHGDLIVRGWHRVISAKLWIAFSRWYCHRRLVLSIMSFRRITPKKGVWQHTYALLFNIIAEGRLNAFLGTSMVLMHRDSWFFFGFEASHDLYMCLYPTEQCLESGRKK